LEQTPQGMAGDFGDDPGRQSNDRFGQEFFEIAAGIGQFMEYAFDPFCGPGG
jgi:hypothetical protein